MEIILLIIGIAVVALLLTRSQWPQPQVIYVPLTVEEPESSGWGCLPLLVIGILALLLLSSGLG